MVACVELNEIPQTHTHTYTREPLIINGLCNRRRLYLCQRAERTIRRESVSIHNTDISFVRCIRNPTEANYRMPLREVNVLERDKGAPSKLKLSTLILLNIVPSHFTNKKECQNFLFS